MIWEKFLGLWDDIWYSETYMDFAEWLAENGEAFPQWFLKFFNVYSGNCGKCQTTHWRWISKIQFGGDIISCKKCSEVMIVIPPWGIPKEEDKEAFLACVKKAFLGE